MVSDYWNVTRYGGLKYFGKKILNFLKKPLAKVTKIGYNKIEGGRKWCSVGKSGA